MSAVPQLRSTELHFFKYLLKHLRVLLQNQQEICWSDAKTPPRCLVGPGTSATTLLSLPFYLAWLIIYDE